jgi:hypothetical protein
MTFSEVYKITSQNLVFSAFTDGAGASGYIDITHKMPGNALMLGWKATTTIGFTGDTTATIMVGVPTDTDRFTADVNKSCFDAGTVASAPIAADVLDGYGTTEHTIRVTVTGASDFGLITAGNMTVEFSFLLL